MNTLVITSENGETFSSISNFFIDYHMTQANGEFVKVYLYLVRLLQAGRAADIQEIADHFQCTSRDICRAIRYWVDRNLLQIEYNQENEPIGLTILHLTAPQNRKESEANSGMDLLHKKSDVTPAAMQSPKSVLPVKQPETPSVPEKKTYTPAQIRSFGADSQMESILYQFEMYWGHTPTTSEYQTLLYIYEQLEFPADLLEYLIEYCASIEHTSHRYMEKVAIDWYERGIRTAKQAKDENSA
ncbi:MAG: DnaD domain protein, partial [Lachnospiraceae bacterium]|nr:DnaD domain protein [Lachnospiraceae bacterium]